MTADASGLWLGAGYETSATPVLVRISNRSQRVTTVVVGTDTEYVTLVGDNGRSLTAQICNVSGPTSCSKHSFNDDRSQ